MSGERVDLRHLRERLSTLGGSLVVAGLQHKARVHIHVNEPADVFRVAGEFGAVSGAEGRRHAAAAAHGALARSPRGDCHRQRGRHSRRGTRPARHPHGAGARALRRAQLPRQGRHQPAEFYDEIARGGIAPKTSQPPPGDFRRQFEFLASHHSAVVSINLTSRASGTCCGRADGGRAHRLARQGHGHRQRQCFRRPGPGRDVRGRVRRRRLRRRAHRRRDARDPAEDTLVRRGRLARVRRARRTRAALGQACGRCAARDARAAQRRQGRVSSRWRAVRAPRPQAAVRALGASAHARRRDLPAGRRPCQLRSGRPVAVAGPAACPTSSTRSSCRVGSALGAHGGPGMLVVGLQEYEKPGSPR